MLRKILRPLRKILRTLLTWISRSGRNRVSPRMSGHCARWCRHPSSLVTDRSSRAVIEAWKAYLDHLNMSPGATEGGNGKRQDLLVDMLQKLAAHLGYHFDRTDIRRASYFPRGYDEAEFEQIEMRKLFLDILRGERGLPVYVPPSSGHEAPKPDDDPALPPNTEPRRSLPS